MSGIKQIRQTFDQEKHRITIAKLKKGGHVFEIGVDPDLAIAYKTKKDVDIKEVLLGEKVFADIERGLAASEHDMKSVLGTEDAIEVAKKILDEGEIQLTAEYRDKKREEKRRKLIEIIRRNSIDPQSGLPHPAKRIELAFEEAKIRLDDFKAAEQQVEEVIKKMRPILPIKFEIEDIQIRIPSEFAAKSYSLLKRSGKIIREQWQNDGSLLCVIEIPAGLKQDFFDSLNALTHGEIETKILKTK